MLIPGAERCSGHCDWNTARLLHANDVIYQTRNISYPAGNVGEAVQFESGAAVQTHGG